MTLEKTKISEQIQICESFLSVSSPNHEKQRQMLVVRDYLMCLLEPKKFSVDHCENLRRLSLEYGVDGHTDLKEWILRSRGDVVLLHGRFPEKIQEVRIADIPLCDPNNEGNWMGWTKGKLEEKGYTVTCPVIIDVWKAPYQQWKEELDRLTINENATLVGLSAGGYALLRYLGETGKKVKKVILVAPGAPGMDRNNGPKLPNEDEFYTYQITPRLKSQIQKQIVIFVSNDESFILRAVEMYGEVLDAHVIKLKNMGHFSFLIKELPELLNEIVS